MKATLTENNNIKAVFKPHLKSEPVTVFLHPRITDCYFSPSSHGNRHGSIDARSIQNAYEAHLRKLDEVEFPGIDIDVMHEDTDGASRKSHFAWDDNGPHLIVRGGKVNDARGEVRRYHHHDGDGYNHVHWGAWSSLEGMTASEKKAFDAAFNEILLDTIPGVVDQLKEGRRVQARAALEKFIEECDKEMEILRAILT